MTLSDTETRPGMNIEEYDAYVGLTLHEPTLEHIDAAFTEAMKYWPQENHGWKWRIDSWLQRHLPSFMLRALRRLGWRPRHAVRGKCTTGLDTIERINRLAEPRNAARPGYEGHKLPSDAWLQYNRYLLDLHTHKKSVTSRKDESDEGQGSDIPERNGPLP